MIKCILFPFPALAAYSQGSVPRDRAGAVSPPEFPGAQSSMSLVLRTVRAPQAALAASHVVTWIPTVQECCPRV